MSMVDHSTREAITRISEAILHLEDAKYLVVMKCDIVLEHRFNTLCKELFSIQEYLAIRPQVDELKK